MEMTDMFKVFRKELDWAGRKLILETGKIARQADGEPDGDRDESAQRQQVEKAPHVTPLLRRRSWAGRAPARRPGAGGR